MKIEIISTGGTADFIRKLGFPVTLAEQVTGSAEILDGRVKTLHPNIFGGILARRDQSSDLKQIKDLSIPLIDLVVVNLYPFHETLGQTLEAQTALIDIGGPSLIRAASKNHRWVTVLSDPSDYSLFLKEMSPNGSVSLGFRKAMATRSFLRTSQYDSMIFNEWQESLFPTELRLAPQNKLRYGENPHQTAVWAGTPAWSLLQGKELSFNNLLDSEAALRLIAEFDEPAIAIIKHNNPCGVAWGNLEGAELFQRAFESDSKSAFGGIVAFNRLVDEALAHRMSPCFLEVVLAPSFTDEARTIFQNKKNLRLIEWPEPFFHQVEIRGAMGGWLLQDRDTEGTFLEFKKMTEGPGPSEELLKEMEGAWKVCKHVRSNAIVISQEGVTLGIGAGQVSRIGSLQIALEQSKARLQGAVLASDAFFPFRDSIDLLSGLPIQAIIQPGGSQRDSEVIQACEQLGLPLYFTGMRHFRH